MGNPRASSNLAPGTTNQRVPFPAGRGPGSFPPAAGRSGARPGGLGLGDDAHQPDAEPLLGDDLVLAAAVLAADVGAPGILLQMENVAWSEELPAAKALHRGAAHEFMKPPPCGMRAPARGAPRDAGIERRPF